MLSKEQLQKDLCRVTLQYRHVSSLEIRIITPLFFDGNFLICWRHGLGGLERTSVDAMKNIDVVETRPMDWAVVMEEMRALNRRKVQSAIETTKSMQAAGINLEAMFEAYRSYR